MRLGVLTMLHVKQITLVRALFRRCRSTCRKETYNTTPGYPTSLWNRSQDRLMKQETKILFYMGEGILKRP
jgi:hypothetical protein